jgi:SnoaL-like domain
LFAPDATYLAGPYEEPYRGLDAIAQMWEAERDSPDEVFDMSHEIVAIEDDVGVTRVTVHYDDPATDEWRNIWITRFAVDGRCVAFEEWPFAPPQQ